MSIESYIDSLRKRRLSPRTLELYQVELRTFERLAGDKERIENHLMGCASGTHSRKLALWKRYLKFSGSKLLDKFEAPKITRKQITFLQDFEVERLVNVSSGAEVDVYIFVLLGLKLGLRIAEIMQISKDSIESGWLRIKRKGGNEQLVPLTEDLKDLLQGFRGFQRSRQFYRDKLSFLSRLSGISKRITPHTLRHTFATLAAQRGANIVTLKEMLGHASIATTDRYCHVTPKALEELINGKA